MQITIDRQQFKQALAAVSLALSSNDPSCVHARHVLIDVTANEATIVGCNRHWIAVYRATATASRVTYVDGSERSEPTADPSTARLLVRHDALAVLIAWLKQQDKQGTITIDTDGTFTCNGATHTITPGACDYPPYAEVLRICATPDAVTAPHAIVLSLDYVATILRAFKAVDEPAIMRFGGSDNPVWIGAPHGPLTCILMTINKQP